MCLKVFSLTSVKSARRFSLLLFFSLISLIWFIKHLNKTCIFKTRQWIWFAEMFSSVVVSADTSFMYMIAGLCMLKLYQKRHPDINASAYTAYACLAAVIFFSVLGVVRAHAHTHTHARTHTHTPSHITHGILRFQLFGRGNTVFWIVFSVIHILATLLLSTQLYYMGRWRLGKTPQEPNTCTPHIQGYWAF